MKISRSELTYDGQGINGPDEYRSRIATFSRGASPEDRAKYGRLFAAAPDMLVALERLERLIKTDMQSYRDGEQWAVDAVMALPEIITKVKEISR